MKHRWITFGAIVIAVVAGLWMAMPALADEPAQEAGKPFECLTCHGNPALQYTFPSGEVWSLYVDKQAFEASVHGLQGFTCQKCHTNITGYPHPTLEATSQRAFQLERYRACAQCHNEQYEATLDSVHGKALSAGNQSAPVCTDCHGTHDITPPDEPRTKIAKACSTCHAAIYEEYLTSAHGAALVDENNLDVPTCVDCHGVHNQEDPNTARFRLNSPQLCAKCHADEAMMAKYGISTNVFNTYVADFHGTTVTLFERVSPDVPTNKPVCYDCHGVHNIQKAEDPNSPVFRENLLRTCQKCHPDATSNFPATWLSHYEPSVQKYPLVFFVELFYKILIPAVLGFMVVYVAIDAFGWLRRRGASKKETM